MTVQKPVLNDSGRKLLGSLDLGGKGETVGNNEAGGDAAASGHGTLNGLSDSHIEVCAWIAWLTQSMRKCWS